MRFVTYDELTSSLDRDRALIQLSAFGGIFPSEVLNFLRSRLKNFADYVGVFAVEGRRVLGQVYVQRIPYDFSDGAGTVTGISAVGTRPDVARSGVARALLTEVHRRERDAGQEYAALWTNRSWGAHGLYEKLGYRDIYSSPWVVHSPLLVARKRLRAQGIRPGHVADLDDLDEFHDRQAEGRLGFSRRPEGFSEARVRARSVDPAKNLIVARRKGKLLGYAHLDRGPWRILCGELMAASREVREALVHEVARAARGHYFVFQHTLVTDTPEIFRGPGYGSCPTGWYGLMGMRLGREWGRGEAVRRFATEDPRFICLAGDRF